MIDAEAYRNDQRIIKTHFSDPCLTLEAVIEKLERYVKDEQLNAEGEVVIRARFGDLHRGFSE